MMFTCVVIFVGAVRNNAAEPEGRSRVHQAPGAVDALKVIIYYTDCSNLLHGLK